MKVETSVMTDGEERRESPAAAAGESGAAAGEHSKVNILLVDDRPDKLLALEAVLSSLGQNLVKARSGKEALKLLLQQEFAVILLDVSMPVMDGFETAALIRRRASTEHTPIIFVTSLRDSENHIAQGYSLGAVDYIISPIVPEVLKTKVSVFVELYKKTSQIKLQAEQLLRVEEAENRQRLSEAADRLEAETKRNRFFTLAIDMLAIANFDGAFMQLNPAWRQTLGHSEAELRARPIIDFAHPGDRATICQELLRVQGSAETVYFEARHLHKDGSVRWLGWSVAPFVSERLLYIFARDITERKRAEDRIQTLNGELQSRVSDLTEINSELEAFNYSISHDLRAPLRAMQGFARALAEDEGSQLSAEAREYADRIITSGGYMDAMLQDLLKYSRLSRAELNLGPVALASALNEVLTVAAKGIKDRNARVEILPIEESVIGHRMTVCQIVSNLIDNALKFVEPNRKPVVRVWTESQPNWVRLIVEDNGIGIEPGHQNKIFGLFERLHNNAAYPGTGIGLAIVRRGTERMGGHVGVESTTGAGSRFWIELPRAQTADHE
jgi:PAS domain S-box-containing protein